ncbi:MAG: hypothetical protein F6K29_27740 [Okeania sp. SIO2G5]|nr:hypothetical protein [Okeania sp. SIO2G5]
MSNYSCTISSKTSNYLAIAFFPHHTFIYQRHILHSSLVISTIDDRGNMKTLDN